jgi:hypothetical protein
MWRRARWVLSASAVVLCLGGCAAGPSGVLQVRQRPTTSPGQPALAPNSFVMAGGNLFGILSARGASVSCPDGGRDVLVSGEVQGQHVTISLSHLRPGQDLYDPPLEGGFSDSVTLTVRGPGNAPPIEYQGGFVNGDYQGVGTLKVARSGRSGAVALQLGPPVGQEPSVQVSGDTTTFGGNAGSISGSWRCP